MSVPELLPCGHPRDCAWSGDEGTHPCRWCADRAWLLQSSLEAVHRVMDKVEALLAQEQGKSASLQARVDAARAAVAGAQFSSVRQVNRLGEAVERALGEP